MRVDTEINDANLDDLHPDEDDGEPAAFVHVSMRMPDGMGYGGSVAIPQSAITPAALAEALVSAMHGAAMTHAPTTWTELAKWLIEPNDIRIIKGGDDGWAPVSNPPTTSNPPSTSNGACGTTASSPPADGANSSSATSAANGGDASSAPQKHGHRDTGRWPMGTFRARPEWVGEKQRNRGASKRRRTDPEPTWRPEPPKRKPVAPPLFGFGEPWNAVTDYEHETGKKSDLQNSCGAFIGGRRCGRTLAIASHVCAQCGIDIARKVFTENDLHRDWCAEQITTEEFQRGRVHVEETIAEQRKRRAAERTTLPPLVYYLRTAPDRVKIGFTTDLPRRLREFRSDESYLLAVEPGGRDVERRRHFELGKWRLHAQREDFAEGAEVTARIDAVVSEHGEPTTWVAYHVQLVQEAS